MNIIEATPNECTVLTEIAFESKGHWGYPKKWLEMWRDILEVTEKSFESEVIFKATSKSGEILGYYRLAKRPPHIVLGFWVREAAMGKGVGRQLFKHMITTARTIGAHSIEWDSDPQAVPFYEKMGGKIVDEKRYMHDGKERVLPIFKMDIQ